MDKRKNSILVFSILFLLVFAGYHIYRETNTILDVPVISTAEAVELMEERQEYQKRIKVQYEGTTLPEIDEQGIFLLPQNGREEYTGRLSGVGRFELAVISPDQKKMDLMASGKPLQLLAYNEDAYRKFQIIFSNLPVLSIENTGEDEEGLLGEMLLIDPTGNGRDGVTEIVSTDCRYHVRGASSRNLDKKSYKLNLLTKEKKSRDKALLGMRKDNDWVLNALYTDSSKLRERIGYDLWEQLTGNNLQNMRYLELILDGQYQGIYGLQEPVDFKTFAGNKDRDYLYSIKDWEVSEEQSEIYEAEFTQDNWMLDVFGLEGKGKTAIDFQAATAILREACRTEKGIENQDFPVQFDADSCIDYELLINMLEAVDNTYKNQKLFARHQASGAYAVEKTPWDLDISAAVKPKCSELKAEQILKDLFLPEELSGSREYIQEQKERYFQARDRFYNEEYLNGLIEQYRGELEHGGAIGRDMWKWQYEDYEEDCETVKGFFEKRIRVLDRYYGGLSWNTEVNENT